MRSTRRRRCSSRRRRSRSSRPRAASSPVTRQRRRPRARTTDDAVASTTTTSRSTTDDPDHRRIRARPPRRPRPRRHAPTPAAPTVAAPTSPPAADRRRAGPRPLLVTQLAGIGSAQQVIAVAASGYGTSTATFTAYERGASGWKQVFGPWFAYIGRNGVAPRGREARRRRPHAERRVRLRLHVRRGLRPRRALPVPAHHRPEHRVGRRPGQPQLQRVDRHEHRVGGRRSRADGQRAVVLLRRGDRLQRRAHARPRQRDLPARLARELDRGLRVAADRRAARRCCAGSIPAGRRAIAIGTLAPPVHVLARRADPAGFTSS